MQNNVRNNTTVYDNRAKRLRAARKRHLFKCITCGVFALLFLLLIILASALSGVISTDDQSCKPSASYTPINTEMPTPSDAKNTAPPTQLPTLNLIPGVSATPACTPGANFNSLIDPNGRTIATRFRVPDGWERVTAEPNSFAQYLRDLPLLEDGATLYFHDGKPCDIPAHAAIINKDMPKKFEQCADTVIHIYSDYLYKTRQYDKLKFTFNNGFVCDFLHFTQGYRPNSSLNGWETASDYWKGTDERVYKVYLEYVFLYANTASLYEFDTIKANADDINIGDMFLSPGFPGHVVMVCDVIRHKMTGEKRFMTLQGSMPAVQAHVMMNALEPELSPWQNTRYDYGGFLSATYWLCPKENLVSFK